MKLLYDCMTIIIRNIYKLYKQVNVAHVYLTIISSSLYCALQYGCGVIVSWLQPCVVYGLYTSW